MQTYQLLQVADSNITNQLIAYQIASQGDRTGIPEALNATISSLLTTSDSTPPDSARWINALLFSSLVLSLAAALFGIMAKQWIREYMKWNTPLASPRDNVLVRHIRFEHWGKWNVEAFVWSIPSLLELAMVLFLAGIIVLLWTLDSFIAIAITTLVSVFLTVVSVLTVLPIFIRHCPFKSPTAWAFVRLSNIAQYFYLKCIAWFYDMWARFVRRRASGLLARRLIHFPRNQTWRTIDNPHNEIESGPTLLQTIKLVYSGNLTAEQPLSYVVRDFDLIANRHSKDHIKEAPALLYALDWLTTASQDEHITRCVDQCINELCPQPENTLLGTSDALETLVADEPIPASWDNIKQQDLYYLSLKFAAKTPFLDSTFSATRLQTLLGLTIPKGALRQSAFCRIGSRFTLGVYDPESYQSIFQYSKVGFYTLAAGLSEATSSISWIQESAQVCKVYIMTATLTQMLYNSSGTWRYDGAFAVDWTLDGLRAILQESDTATKRQVYRHAPGLCSLVFWLASRYNNLTVSPTGEIGEWAKSISLVIINELLIIILIQS